MLLLTTQPAACSLCTLMTRLKDAPFEPDSLSGSGLPTVLASVLTDGVPCGGPAPPLPHSYTTGPIALSPAQLVVSDMDGALASSQTSGTVATATLSVTADSGGRVAVTVSLRVSTLLASTAAPTPLFDPVPLLADLSLALPPLPLSDKGIAALPLTHLPWAGSLYPSDPEPGVYIHDSALFDGLGAVTLFAAFQDPEVLAVVEGLARALRAPLTDTNIRMTGGAATLADSSLPARGLFLDADSDLFHMSQMRYGTRVSGDSGLYVFAEASCAGSQCAAPLQRLVARNLVATALHPHCAPALLPDSALVSSSVASMWISYDPTRRLADVVPMSGVASTLAFLDCPANDTVVSLAVQATTTAQSLVLPDVIVEHDLIAVYATLNAYPPLLSGSLLGLVQGADASLALPSADIFGPSRACLLPAPPATAIDLTSSADAVLSSLRSALLASPRVPHAAFDAVLTSLLPPAGPALDAVLAAFAGSRGPSSMSPLEFWYWYASVATPTLLTQSLDASIRDVVALSFNVSAHPADGTLALSLAATLSESATTNPTRLSEILDAVLGVGAAGPLNAALASLVSGLESRVPGSTSGLTTPLLSLASAPFVAQASVAGHVTLTTVLGFDAATGLVFLGAQGPVHIDAALTASLSIAGLDGSDPATAFPGFTVSVSAAAPPDAPAAPLTVDVTGLPLANFAAALAARVGSARGALAPASSAGSPSAILDAIIANPAAELGPIFASGPASLTGLVPWLFHGLDPLPYSPASLGSPALDLAVLFTEVLLPSLPSVPTSSLDLAAALSETFTTTLANAPVSVSVTFAVEVVPSPRVSLSLGVSSLLEPRLRTSMASWASVLPSARVGPAPLTASLFLAAELTPSSALVTDAGFSAALNVTRFVVPLNIGMEGALTLDGSFHVAASASLPSTTVASLALELTAATPSLFNGLVEPRVFDLLLRSDNLFASNENSGSPIVFSLTARDAPTAGAAAVPTDLTPERALGALISSVFRLATSLFDDGGTLDLELAPLGTSIGSLALPKLMQDVSLARLSRPLSSLDAASAAAVAYQGTTGPILASLPSPWLAAPSGPFNQTLLIALNGIPELGAVCVVDSGAVPLSDAAALRDLVNTAFNSAACDYIGRILSVRLDTDDDALDPLSGTGAGSFQDPPSALNLVSQLPGVVRSLSITVLDNPLGLTDGPFPVDTPFQVEVGGTVIVPQFSSLLDLSILVASALLPPSARDLLLPSHTTIPVAELGSIIPPAWADYYPPALDAYMVGIAAGFDYAIDPPLPFASSFATPASARDVISLSTASPGQLTGFARAYVSGGFGAVMGAPPSGSGAAVLFTNFGSESAPEPLADAVVVAPNNTATFVVGYNVHTKGGPGSTSPPLYQESLVSLVLPPGSRFNDTIYTTFAAAAAAALPDPRIVTAEPYTSLTAQLYNASAMSTSSGVDRSASAFQVKFTSRAVEDTSVDLLYVPIVLRISESSVPALAQGSGVPGSQVRMVVERLNAGLTANLTATLEDVTGRVGIVSVRSGRTSASVDLAVTAGPAPGTPRVAVVASLLDAVLSPDKLFGSFSVGVSLDARVVVDDLSVDVLALTFPSLPTLTLAMDIDALAILDNMALSSLTFEWGASWSGGFDAVNAYQALAAGAASPCDIMDIVVYGAQVVFSSPIATARIPGTKLRLSQLGSDSVLAKLDALRLAVCTRTSDEPLTLTLLCSLADIIITETDAASVLGGSFDVCGSGLLTADGVVRFTLARRPFSTNVTTGAFLDLPNLLGGSHGSLPNGDGASAQLVATAAVDYALAIEVDLARAAIRLVPDVSYIQVSASIDFDGEVSLAFGALSVRLGEAHMDLSGPGGVGPATLRGSVVAAGGVGGSSFLPNFAVELSGSASVDASLTLGDTTVCEFAASVPDLSLFLDGHVPASVLESGFNCESGVLEALQLALGDLTIQAFFSEDVMALLNAWINGIGEFLTKVEAFLSRTNLDVGFLGAGFSERVTTRLRTRLLEPVTLRELVSSVNELVTQLRSPEGMALPPSDVPRWVWAQVLDVVCDAMADVMIECPALPTDAIGQDVAARFVLGDIEVVQLDTLDFRLGARGLAEAAVNCDLDLNLDWRLTFELSFSKSGGLRLDFASAAPVDLSAAVVMQPGCAIAGQLAVLGFEMAPTPAESGLSLSLSVAPGFSSATLSFGATLGGDATFGLGGVFNKLVDEAEAKDPGSGALLRIAPHVEWHLAMGWSFTGTVGAGSGFVSAPPTFELANGKLCMGTFLTRLVGGILRQADKIIGPLEPFIGEDGYLVREIKYTDLIFGRQLSALEMGSVLCRIYDCSVDDVIVAVEKFITLINIAQRLESLATSSNDPCDLYLELQDLQVLLERVTSSLGGDRAAPFEEAPGFVFAADVMVASDGLVLHPNDLVTAFTGPEPPKDLVGSASDPGVNEEFNEILALMGGTTAQPVADSDSGFRLYLLEGSIATKMVKILFGMDTPLVGFYIPPAKFSLAPTWSWVVWPAPLVTVHISIPMSVSLYVGDVAVMSSGVIDAVTQKNVGLIAKGIAIKTVNDNGSKRWTLQGSIGIAGGASVNVLVIKASAAVGLQLVGKLRFVSVNGNAWLTVDELAWMVRTYGVWDSLEKKLSLELYITAKIKVFALFGYKTIAKWSKTWSWPLYEAAPAALPPAAGAGGLVNFGLLAGSTASAGDLAAAAASDAAGLDGWLDGDVLDTLPKYAVYETLTATGVELVTAFRPEDHTAGASSLTRTFSVNDIESVGVLGEPGAAAFVYDVGLVHKIVSLPPGPGMVVRMGMEPYAGLLAMTAAQSDVAAGLSSARTVVVTRGRVAPGAASGATFDSTNPCASLVLDRPLAGLVYDVRGAPCAMQVTTGPGSRVAVSGDVSGFSGSPIVVRGNATSVGVSLGGVSEVAVSGPTVTSASGLALSVPDALFNLTVSARDADTATRFVLHDAPATRFSLFEGGAGGAELVVPSVRGLSGHVGFTGTASVTNMVNVTGTAGPGETVRLTTSSSVVMVSDASGNHSVSHANVHTVFVQMNAAAGATVDAMLMSPADGSRVEYTMAGDTTTSMTTTVTGCGGQSQHIVRMQGGGNMTTILRDVSTFACTVYVYGSLASDQTDTLVLEDMVAAGPRTHVQINRGGMVIFDPLRAFQPVNVFFEAVERLEINFSGSGTSSAYYVELTAGTVGTETVIALPPIPRAATGPATNFVHIMASTSAVLVTGTYDMRVGVDPGASSAPATSAVAPLDFVRGPVFVAPANTEPYSGTNVALNGGLDAPGVAYVLDAECLGEFSRSSDPSGATPLALTPPSDWFCSVASGPLSGAPSFAQCGTSSSVAACPVNLVSGAYTVLSMGLGSGDDAILGRDLARTRVALDTGLGDDMVVWHNALTEDARISVDLGPGADVFVGRNIAGHSEVSVGAGDGAGDALVVCHDVASLLMPPSLIVDGDGVPALTPTSSDAASASQLRLVGVGPEDSPYVASRRSVCDVGVDGPLSITRPVGPPAFPGMASTPPSLPVSDANCGSVATANMTGLAGVRLEWEAVNGQCMRVVGEPGGGGAFVYRAQAWSHYALEIGVESTASSGFTAELDGWPEISSGTAVLRVDATSMTVDDPSALLPGLSVSAAEAGSTRGAMVMGSFEFVIDGASHVGVDARCAQAAAATACGGVDIVVQGTPNDADMVVLGGGSRSSVRFPQGASDGSTVPFQGSVAVLSNVAVLVGEAVATGGTSSFVVVGSESDVRLFPMQSAGRDPAVQLWHGCMERHISLPPLPDGGGPVLSMWAGQIVDALPEPVTSSEVAACLPGPLVVSGAGALTVSANNVSLASLDPAFTVGSVVVAGAGAEDVTITVEPAGAVASRPGWWTAWTTGQAREADAWLDVGLASERGFGLGVSAEPNAVVVVSLPSAVFAQGAQVSLNTSSVVRHPWRVDLRGEDSSGRRTQTETHVVSGGGDVELWLGSGAGVLPGTGPSLSVTNNNNGDNGVMAIDTQARFVSDDGAEMVEREVSLEWADTRVTERGAGDAAFAVTLAAAPRVRYTRRLVFEDVSLNWVRLEGRDRVPDGVALPGLYVPNGRAGLVVRSGYGAESVLLGPGGNEVELDAYAGTIGTGGVGTDRVSSSTMACVSPGALCTASAMAKWSVAESACFSAKEVQTCQGSASAVIEASGPLQCRVGTGSGEWMVSLDGTDGAYSAAIAGDAEGSGKLSGGGPGAWPVGGVVVLLSLCAWGVMVVNLLTGHVRDPAVWARFVVTAGLRGLVRTRPEFVNEPAIAILEGLGRWAEVWVPCAPARVGAQADERVSVSLLLGLFVVVSGVMGVFGWVFHRPVVRKSSGRFGFRAVDDAVFVGSAGVFLFLFPWAASVALVSIRHDGVWSVAVAAASVVGALSMNRGAGIARKRMGWLVSGALGVGLGAYLAPVGVASVLGGPSWPSGDLGAAFMMLVVGCSVGESVVWVVGAVVEGARPNHLRDMSVGGFLRGVVLVVKSQTGTVWGGARAVVQLVSTCAGLGLVYGVRYGSWSRGSWGLAALWAVWVLVPAAMGMVGWVRGVRRRWAKWRRVNLRSSQYVAGAPIQSGSKRASVELDALQVSAYAASFEAEGVYATRGRRPTVAAGETAADVLDELDEMEPPKQAVRLPASRTSTLEPVPAAAVAAGGLELDAANAAARDECVRLVMRLAEGVSSAEERYEVMMDVHRVLPELPDEATALHFWWQFLESYCAAYARELEMDSSTVDAARSNAAGVQGVNYVELLPELRVRLTPVTAVAALRAPPSVPAAPSSPAAPPASSTTPLPRSERKIRTRSRFVAADIASQAQAAAAARPVIVSSESLTSYSSSDVDGDEDDEERRIRRLRRAARKKSMVYPDKDRPDAVFAEGQSRHIRK